MADATALLNFGFANYQKFKSDLANQILEVPVSLGKEKSVHGVLKGNDSVLIEKEKAGNITQKLEMNKYLKAPVKKGQTIGTLTLESGEKILLKQPIIAEKDVPALTVFQLYQALLAELLMSPK